MYTNVIAKKCDPQSINSYNYPRGVRYARTRIRLGVTYFVQIIIPASAESGQLIRQGSEAAGVRCQRRTCTKMNSY